MLARGIDVKGIEVVINFDVPGDGEDYVHRIGRTARAEASGVAITYVNRKDKKRFQRIEELIEAKIQFRPLPEDLVPMSVSAKSGPRQGSGKKPFPPKPAGQGDARKKKFRKPPPKKES